MDLLWFHFKYVANVLSGWRPALGNVGQHVTSPASLVISRERNGMDGMLMEYVLQDIVNARNVLLRNKQSTDTHSCCLGDVTLFALLTQVTPRIEMDRSTVFISSPGLLARNTSTTACMHAG